MLRYSRQASLASTFAGRTRAHSHQTVARSRPVIRRSRDTGERELMMMRWGIVPWFAKTEGEFKALSTITRLATGVESTTLLEAPTLIATIA
jgi:putative SOS response-associated peptidase YedK